MRLVPSSRFGWLVAGWVLTTSVMSAPAQDQPAKPASAPAVEPKQVQAPAASSATDPAPRPGKWMEQHEKFLALDKQGDVDLLFLGDSITAGWNSARDVWTKFYDARKPANFGIGGDRTQHILWRLDHGEVDHIRPQVVVLMIGTNNLGANSNDEIVDGVRAILDRLHAKLPATKVLLLGIFPRGATRDRSQALVPPEPRVAAINEQLAKLDDDGKTVKYLDIGSTFLDDGKVSKAIMPDFLHLTPAAYGRWADAIEPTLSQLLDEPKAAKAGS